MVQYWCPSIMFASNITIGFDRRSRIAAGNHREIGLIDGFHRSYLVYIYIFISLIIRIAFLSDSQVHLYNTHTHSKREK